MEIYHVHPVDDLKEHITTGWPKVKCWCRPVEQEEEEGLLVVHNSLDRREDYEGLMIQ